MKENFIKWGMGAGFSSISYLLGGVDSLLQTLLLFMLLDYVTGLLASGVEGKISSKIGYKGILKKIGILVVVVLSHQLDQLGLAESLGDVIIIDSPARTLAILFYISMEGVSNIENLGRMGVPLPKFLQTAFDVLREKGGK